jgi:hypothetical protein
LRFVPGKPAPDDGMVDRQDTPRAASSFAGGRVGISDFAFFAPLRFRFLACDIEIGQQLMPEQLTIDRCNLVAAVGWASAHHSRVPLAWWAEAHPTKMPARITTGHWFSALVSLATLGVASDFLSRKSFLFP